MEPDASRLPHAAGIPLHDYLDERISAQMDAVLVAWRSHEAIHQMLDRAEAERAEAVRTLATQHAQAHDREHVLSADALNKATAALDKRMEAMNEFRQQLNDQATTFARSETVTVALRNLQERIEATDRSREAQFQAVTQSHLDRITQIEKTLFTMQGRSGGASATVVWIFAGLAAVSTIISLLVIFARVLVP